MAGERRVIVVGSGAAGCAAAVAAAAEGAAVTLLERADVLGGTTAFSGGGIWIPANHCAAAEGLRDSPREALRYLRALGLLGDADVALAEVYVGEAARIVEAIEAKTPLRWRTIVNYPDYYAELEGGKPHGRSLEIHPVEVGTEVVRRVRPNPYGALPMTHSERDTGGVAPDELARRRRDGIIPRGRGLIAGLYVAARELGVDVRTGVRAGRLLTSGDAVVGLEAGGEPFAGQVIIACGGFERDPALVRSFLRAPTAPTRSSASTRPATPPPTRSASPTPAAAPRSGRPSSSAGWAAPPPPPRRPDRAAPCLGTRRPTPSSCSAQHREDRRRSSGPDRAEHLEPVPARRARCRRVRGLEIGGRAVAVTGRERSRC